MSLVNFSSVITVNKFLRSGDTLFAASSGGLVVHGLRGGGNTLISNAKIFPDPHLTALCRDRRGNLWAGSRKGYLYRMTPKGQFSVYSNYKTSGWGVNDLYTYGNVIVVGSDRGVSLFDPEKGVVARNAVSIADFGSPRVNVIASRGDTLFLGCDEGVAYLDSLDIVPLPQRNFYYPGIWKTRRDVQSPVMSFINAGETVVSRNKPSAVFRGQLFWADSGKIYSGDSLLAEVLPFPGRILTLHNEGDRRLWIGTDEQYYFSYDVYEPPRRHDIYGPIMRIGTRVSVAGNGDVWALSLTSHRTGSWHHGVYRYDGQDWHLYNQHTLGSRFGYFGDDGALGITFGGSGGVWVGTWGGNVKHIDHANNVIGHLMVGNRNFTDISYYANTTPHGDWGKVDALASDSAGYLWASVYDHNSGSLLCYDPRALPNANESDPVKAGFRWFFSEYPYKTQNITELCVDIDNRIFAYDGPQSRLTIFSHGGNPLKDGIRIDTSYARFGTVSAIRSAPDGTTYIAGTGGLQKVPRGSLEVKTVDNTLTGLSDIAVQGDVLWLGMFTNGVMRYALDTGEKTRIGEAEGLPSDNVRSVAVDNRKGYLWVLTDESLSRLDIGTRTAAARNEPMRAFPNVFSISRNLQGARDVTFTRLEPRSTVSVYTVNGALVAKVSAEHFTEKEWRAAWEPKRTLTPGTYIAVASPSGKRVKIVLKP